MNEDKKVYVKPELTIHGNFEQITMIDGFVNPTDTPNGEPNDAFPLS